MASPNPADFKGRPVFVCEQRDKRPLQAADSLAAVFGGSGWSHPPLKVTQSLKKSLKETVFKSSGDCRQATAGGMLMLDCTDKND